MALINHGPGHRAPGFYWVSFQFQQEPARFDGSGWHLLGIAERKSEQDLDHVGPPIQTTLTESQIRALRLRPDDVLALTLRESDDVARSAMFLRNLLDRAGHSNEFLLLTNGRNIEKLVEIDDARLAAMGLQRAGSWRTRPPLL